MTETTSKTEKKVAPKVKPLPAISGGQQGGSYADGALLQQTQPQEQKPDPAVVTRRQARKQKG
jgi:hypothetical protein